MLEFKKKINKNPVSFLELRLLSSQFSGVPPFDQELKISDVQETGVMCMTFFERFFKRIHHFRQVKVIETQWIGYEKDTHDQTSPRQTF